MMLLWIFLNHLFHLCIYAHTAHTHTTQNINFEHISLEDGLSQNNVYWILQDYKGFMWIGAWYRGLNRYDGFNIKFYLPDPADSTSLLGSRVYIIFSDSKNNLWIGTDKGLNLYNREKDNFIHFKHTDIPNGFTSVTSIEEDKNGILWIATSDHGLIKFDLKADKFTHIPLKINRSSYGIEYFSKNSIYSCLNVFFL